MAVSKTKTNDKKKSASSKTAPKKAVSAKKGAPAKKVAVKKTAPKKIAPAKSSTKIASSKKAAPAKKAPLKKTAPVKATAKKTAPAKKAPVKKAVPAKKAPQKKATPTKKSVVLKTVSPAKKTSSKKLATQKKTPLIKAVPAKKLVNVKVSKEKSKSPQKTTAKAKTPLLKPASKKVQIAEKKTPAKIVPQKQEKPKTIISKDENRKILNTTEKTKVPVKSVEKKEKSNEMPVAKDVKKNASVETERKIEQTVKTAPKKSESKKDPIPEPAHIQLPEGNLEKSIRLKLEALYSLQVIDTQIDKIRIIRGELPLEVQDLEDEIAGMNTRLENFNAEIAAIDKSKAEFTQEIARSKEMVKKYEQQQKNVRNNREFESLAKEIEFQDLEVQLRNKKIKEADVAREAKQKMIDELRKILDGKVANLKDKMGELSEIIAETEKEEEILLKKSEKAKIIIEERYLNAYNRIRKSVRNGLAVVKIERHSCGGCFSKIPPQRQMEIRMHKKVLVCEYCGRIIVDESICEAVDNQN